MTGSCRPIINPPLTNPVGTLDQFPTRFVPVLDDYDNSGIELLLRMLDIGRAWSFRRNDIVDSYLDAVGLEDRMTVRISSGRRQISQNKEIGYLRRSRQPHEI